MLPLAHETWLTDDAVGADWGFVTEELTLGLLAAALAAMDLQADLAGILLGAVMMRPSSCSPALGAGRPSTSWGGSATPRPRRVYGSSPALRPLVSAAWPWRRPAPA